MITPNLIHIAQNKAFEEFQKKYKAPTNGVTLGAGDMGR
jgi:hypothetical protein